MNTLSPHRYDHVPLPEQRDAPEVPQKSPDQQAKAAPAAAKGRDAFFDNAKYLAIVFVAMGHAWEPLIGRSHTVKALYTVVYAFHMPAFILISGYFSRSFDARPDRVKRLVTGVAVPYVLFEVVYALFKRWADDTTPHYPISLVDPWFVTWFLVALFIWRVTTPIWRIVRWPVPLALVIAALTSTSPGTGNDLGLQRVLQFLPFFVAGLCMRPEHFHILRRREARILTLPVIAAATALAYWAAPLNVPGWLYHRDSAQTLGAPWWMGPVSVIVLFACSMLLAGCFFAWVPRRRMWFTTLGAGTLYGYLLHGFAIKIADFQGWFDTYQWLHSPLGEVTVTVVAATLVTALCTSPVRRVFRFVVEPRMEWAFKAGPGGVRREVVSPGTR